MRPDHRRRLLWHGRRARLRKLSAHATLSPVAGNQNHAACVPGEAAFCDAFDDGPLGGRWTSENEGGGATLVLDGTDPLSPPNALRANGTSRGHAYLSKTFAGNPRHVRCELDVRVASRPSVGEVEVLSLETSGSNTWQRYHLFVQIDGGRGWQLGEYGNFDGEVTRITGVPGVPFGRWVHLAFETDGSSASLSVDGSVAATLRSLAMPAAGTSRRLDLGLVYVSTPTAYGVLYDNLACTLAS